MSWKIVSTEFSLIFDQKFAKENVFSFRQTVSVQQNKAGSWCGRNTGKKTNRSKVNEKKKID